MYMILNNENFWSEPNILIACRSSDSHSTDKKLHYKILYNSLCCQVDNLISRNHFLKNQNNFSGGKQMLDWKETKTVGG